MMDILKWIQSWYYENCDGDWEHLYGVRIDSIEEERNEEDWFYCIVRDGVFHSAGGAKNLEEMLNCFKNWASSLDRS